MFTILWDDDHEQVDSVSGVERVLDRLHQRYRSGDPTLVTVERNDGGSLSIGLGADVSVLTYVRSDKNPPYYVSSGGTDEDEVMSFRFGGDLSEYPIRNALPISAARAAMTCFCETGALSNDVSWEET